MNRKLSNTNQDIYSWLDADGQTVHVCSAHPVTIHQLDKAAKSLPNKFKCAITHIAGGKIISKEYLVDAKRTEYENTQQKENLQ